MIQYNLQTFLADHYDIEWLSESEAYAYIVPEESGATKWGFNLSENLLKVIRPKAIAEWDKLQSQFVSATDRWVHLTSEEIFLSSRKYIAIVRGMDIVDKFTLVVS